MIRNNLVGFVKMAIIGNPNVDNATATTLCQYVDDLKVLIDNQDSLIKALRNALGCASADMKYQDTVIANLRKDIAGMEDEIFRLRELNNNQAWIIANNRTKRSDFNV